MVVIWLIFLARNSNLTVNELLEMAIDVARGMSYLEEKSIVHRDLACRNLLIDGKRKIKVNDFGMSRENQYQSSDTAIPVRWASPEMICQMKVTSKSDSYSFGVVLWEIFSFAKQPYYGLSNNQVAEIVCDKHKIEKLEKPDNCPEILYKLMTRCWSFESTDRPTFKEILKELTTIKGTHKEKEPVVYANFHYGDYANVN